MLSVFAVLHVIKITLLGAVLIVGFVYVGLTITAHQVWTSIDILTVNVCVTCMLCAGFWIVYHLLEIINPVLMRYDELCWFYSYVQNVSVCEVIYAFCVVSLDRYLIVVFTNNPYFKRRQWAVICLVIQWMLGGLLLTPLWLSKTCNQFGIPWSYQLYKLFIVIILPSGFTIALHGMLFIFIRNSTVRVQSTVGQRARFTRRDACLLKHMMFIIIVYVGSWAPIYTAALADVYHNFPPVVYAALNVLPNLSLLIGTIDLFLHNNRIKQIVTPSWLSFRTK